MIKAIETQYKGYRFRSRLEARWAVFFDALGLQWEYEPEGFNLDGIYYLPDFWISTVNMWAEVKPEQLTPDQREPLIRLARESKRPVLMLIGVPEDEPYWAIEYQYSHDENDNIVGNWYEFDYCLTNYHNYPRDEHRFYCCPGGGDDDHHEDTYQASIAAKSARFEHGEMNEIKHSPSALHYQSVPHRRR